MIIGAGDTTGTAVGDAGGEADFTPIGGIAIAVGVGTVATSNGTGPAGANTGGVVRVTHIAAASAVGFVCLCVHFTTIADA